MKRRFLFPALLALVAVALAVLAQVKTTAADAITQPEHRFGLAAMEQDDVYLSLPAFHLEGKPEGVTSAGSQVFLWEFCKQVNGGKNLPTLRQETSDCTAFATVGGIHYLQCQAIANGEPVEFQELHPAFNYGVSRTAPDIGNGRLGRSGGAVPEWSVEATRIYGVLPLNAPGVPPYSGSLSDRWGISGPPKELYKLAEPYKLGSFARCADYEDIRDAISSGYPVVIGSNQGFKMQPQKYRDRMFGVPSGTWAHQMVFVGVDDTAECPDGSKGALYILNSWGAAAHGKPLNGEPEGGFWISSKVANRMAATGRALALSNFSGFPYRPLNIRVFGSSAPAQLIATTEPPPGIKFLPEYLGIDRPTTNKVAGVVLALAGLTAIPRPPRFRKRGISRELTA